MIPGENDAVRIAVRRYFDRFPDLQFARTGDAVTAALFKHLERALVQADIAMQDEGLSADARRRVVTSALYGSVDEEAAIGRMRDAQAEAERLSAAVRSGRLQSAASGARIVIEDGATRLFNDAGEQVFP